MLIHVADAIGIPPETMRNPAGLVSSMPELLRDDTVVPWRDLTVLAQRVSSHFGDSENALRDFGRSYYLHLGNLPYTRLAANVLTLRGALYLAQRYTTPHNYEALICTSQWLTWTECIKTNRLKYESDPNSDATCHITYGVLEYFPTLFGREPMKRIEMEIRAREVAYHFTLPNPIGARKFFLRAFRSVTQGNKNWEILKTQESLLVSQRWNAHRSERLLEEAVTHARSQERANFSRDLHDGLGQTLSGIAYRIAALRQAQPDDSALAELDGGIRSALAQARMIAHETSTLAALSLQETLRLTTTSFAGLTNVSIAFTVGEIPNDPSILLIHEIDMMVREALANAVRHSKASNISVSIGVQMGNLELEIRDDGIGIPLGQMQGFGMKSILARAMAANGTASWHAGNPGTILLCILPLPSP